MFVGLARSCHSPSVVKTQSFEFRHADPERFEIIQVEQSLLMFELAGDDQQVVIDDIELVQYGQMSRRDLCYGEFRFWR